MTRPSESTTSVPDGAARPRKDEAAGSDGEKPSSGDQGEGPAADIPVDLDTAHDRAS